MNYDPAEILAAQDYFGFARSAPIEKDWHVVYGEKPAYADALDTIISIVKRL